MRAHPTVALIVENLRREGDAVGWLLFLGDVLPHPHAVVHVAGDVQLGVVHFKSLQETNHILLLLLDLGGRKKYKPSKILTDCRIHGNEAVGSFFFFIFCIN